MFKDLPIWELGVDCLKCPQVGNSFLFLVQLKITRTQKIGYVAGAKFIINIKYKHVKKKSKIKIKYK